MLENIVFACFYMFYKPHNALLSVLLVIVNNLVDLHTYLLFLTFFIFFCRSRAPFAIISLQLEEFILIFPVVQVYRNEQTKSLILGCLKILSLFHLHSWKLIFLNMGFPVDLHSSPPLTFHPLSDTVSLSPRIPLWWELSHHLPLL